MSIVLNGTTGITTPDIDSAAAPDFDGSNLTGVATATQGALASTALQPDLAGVTSVDETTVATLAAAGVGGISKVDTSGASQTLDVSSGNLFVSSAATADTTVSFSNVPTEASWGYVFDSGLEGFAGGAKLETFNFYSPPNGIPAISTLITAIKFKPDGTKAYLLDRDSIYVKELNLSTPWLLSTATGITDTVYIGGYESYNMMLDFSADGTKMYTGGFGSKRCTQWNMSTAWDISTASYSGNNFDLAAGTTSNDPNSFVFSADGTKLYLSCSGRDKIFQYDLTTPWDVGTASYSNKFFSVSQYYLYGVNFKPDGTKMYLNHRTSIRTYNLSTPWDVSTASSGSPTLVPSASNTLERDVEISPDGLYAYAIDGSYKIVTYSVGSGFDLTLPSSVNGTPLSLGTNEKLYCEFLTIDGGTNVDIINQKVLG